MRIFPKLLMTFLMGTLSAYADPSEKLQLRGFFSQGLVYSKSNNFYGESTDSSGSLEFFEGALNASWRPVPRLRVVGQLLARDAGATDNGSIRTDFLFTDFRIVDLATSTMGARIGRVKNPFGFYNDTRDVIFTRPGILLPQSIYFEGNGAREIFFSSDGLQLYSDWYSGDSNSSFILSLGRDKDVSANTLGNLFGTNAAIDVRSESPTFMRFIHEIDGGAWRLGTSYMRIDLAFTPQSGSFFPAGSLDTEIFLLSVQRNTERWTWTSEYSVRNSQFSFGGFNGAAKGEGAYLQGQYRWAPTWSSFMRYDIALDDRERPNQTDSHDLTIGLRWEPAPNWNLSAEAHGVRGTAGIPRPDNANRTIDERSELYLVMLSFRF